MLTVTAEEAGVIAEIVDFTGNFIIFLIMVTGFLINFAFQLQNCFKIFSLSHRPKGTQIYQFITSFSSLSVR